MAWQAFRVTGLHRRTAEIAEILAEVAPGSVVRQLEAFTRTAAEAAAALGCEVGAIANSLVFASDKGPVLILTSGAHRVDLALVASTTGWDGLRRATPEEVRDATGQAIGGVAPVGHPSPLPTLVDQDLADYPTVWAAAGTPHSVFSTSYDQLLSITGGRPCRVAQV
jgi:prolyl-tRNA editing enzyme YbaK/EbsC (Cys-tRNA(Pro) deacylase)